VELIDIPTEQTTAVTDAVLAVLAAGCVVYLSRIGSREPWKRNVWSWAFGLLALSAALGAVAHGFKMSAATNHLLWQPLNFALGLTVALFAVGVVYDMWGERVARRALPVMIIAGVIFYMVTLFFPDTFLVFILYETAVIAFALGVYGTLSVRKRFRGAGLMAAGMLVTMIAGTVQATESLYFTFIWQFDYNGIFHLVQMAGVLALIAGLRAALHPS